MNNKTETLEIDLNEFSKEDLISLINSAHEKNLTFNELIVQLLSNFLAEKNTDDKNQLQLF
jgi:hypothetical protein